MHSKTIILLATVAITIASSPTFAAKATTTSSGWNAGVVLTSAGKPDPTRGDPQQNSVAVNASGLAIAAWDHYEYTPYPYGAEWVEAAVQLPGGKWSAPLRLSDASWYAYHPRVAVAGDGTVFVAWTADSGAATQPQKRQIQARVRPAGSTAWSPVFVLGTGAVGPVLPSLDYVQLAVDQYGHAVLAGIVWNTNTQLIVASYDPAAGWGPTVTLSAAGENAILPSLAMNPAGDAVIAWSLSGWGTTYTPCTVRLAKRPAVAVKWGDAVTLASQSSCMSYYSALQVAIDGSGQAIVSWAYESLIVMRETNGWQLEKIVTPVPPQSIGSPSLVSDYAGNLTLAYSIWDPNIGVDRGSAYVQTSPPNGINNWSSYRFTYPASQDAQFVRASTSPDGSLTFVGWIDNYNSVLQVSQRASTGAWLKPQTVGKSSNMGFAQYFSISTAKGGNARVVWKTQSGQSQVASQFRP